MTKYRLLTVEDLPEVLSLKLRESDIEELRASMGLPPEEALPLCIKASTITWVGVHNGKLEAIFGLTELDKETAAPWFMATDKFDQFRYYFAKTSIEVIRIMQEHYPKLVNLVLSTNADVIKWLRWLGFQVHEDQKYYLKDPKLPFFKFEKGGDCQCAAHTR